MTRKNKKTKTTKSAVTPQRQAGSSRRQRNRRRGVSTRGILANVGGSLLGKPGHMIGSAVEGIIGGLIGGNAGSAPAAFANRVASAQSSSSVQEGQEQLGVITVPVDAPPGTVIMQGLVASPEIGTRLAKIAELWSRTEFLDLSLMVTASNGTSAGGTYILGYDPDPTVTYASGPELPGRLMSLQRAIRANIWANAGIECALTRAVLFNKTGASDTTGTAEIRQYADGQYILATASDITAAGTGDTVSLSISVHWRVRLSQPNTAPSATEGEGYFLYTTGKSYQLPATKTDFQFGRGEPWLGNVPPNGTYTFLPGQYSVSAFYNTVTPITGLQIDGNNTYLLSDITPSASGRNGEIRSSTPTIFRLNTSSRAMVKQGFALVSPTLASPSHEIWRRNSTEARLKMRMRNIAKDALVDKLKSDFATMNLGDLYVSAGYARPSELSLPPDVEEEECGERLPAFRRASSTFGEGLPEEVLCQPSE